MQIKNNKINFRDDAEKQKYLKEIIAYFQDQRGEEIGVIAAEDILDFFLEEFGEEIYRKAVKDCQKILKEKTSDIDVELQILAGE